MIVLLLLFASLLFGQSDTNKAIELPRTPAGAAQPDYAAELRSIKAAIEKSQERDEWEKGTFWLLVGTTVFACAAMWAALRQAKAAQATVAEMRRQTEIEFRPLITVDSVDPEDAARIARERLPILTLRNVGRGVALSGMIIDGIASAKDGDMGFSPAAFTTVPANPLAANEVWKIRLDGWRREGDRRVPADVTDVIKALGRSARVATMNVHYTDASGKGWMSTLSFRVGTTRSDDRLQWAVVFNTSEESLHPLSDEAFIQRLG